MRIHIKSILTKLQKLSLIDKGLIVIAFLMLILRFYNLYDHATYLGDQGRDAIIIKRILTLEHFPAIGAPTSIGMVYLGPFYYYFMAPWLLLFNFNPFGLAFGVAFLSVILGLLATFIIYRHFNKLTAFFFLFFLTFSSSNISLSRFSWNPNLLPIFTFFTVYCFYRLLIDKKSPKIVKNYFYSILFGAIFSFSFQLHYLAALLFPTFIFVFIYQLIKTKKITLYFPRLLVSITSFLLFSLPLLIFDLRHNFLNTNNFIKLFSQDTISNNSSFLDKLIETTNSLWANFGQFSLSGLYGLILFGLVLLLAIKFIKKENNLLYLINLTNLFFYTIGFSLVNSGRFEHYYTPVYYSLFIVLSVVFAIRYQNCKVCRSIIILIFLFYLGFNLLKFKVIFTQGSKQIKHSQKVANHLSQLIGSKPYNIATWPVQLSEDNYLYFLELWGKKPANRQKIEITDQMFVLCETQICPVIDSPSWNISMFGKGKIVKITNIEGLKIFKLVHINNK